MPSLHKLPLALLSKACQLAARLTLLPSWVRTLMQAASRQLPPQSCAGSELRVTALVSLQYTTHRTVT